MFPPYAARSPVKGRTSPILRSNAHDAGLTAARVAPALAVRAATASVPTPTRATAIEIHVRLTSVHLRSMLLGRNRITVDDSPSRCNHPPREYVSPTFHHRDSVLPSEA